MLEKNSNAVVNLKVRSTLNGSGIKTFLACCSENVIILSVARSGSHFPDGEKNANHHGGARGAVRVLGYLLLARLA